MSCEGKQEAAGPSQSNTQASEKVSVPGRGKPVRKEPESWSHEEEAAFFLAIRKSRKAKNWKTITKKVKTKNKEQVRHYYYRMIKRMNKVLSPQLKLDARVEADVNAAMLIWWSLMKAQECNMQKLLRRPAVREEFKAQFEAQLLSHWEKQKDQDKPDNVDRSHNQVLGNIGNQVALRCCTDPTTNLSKDLEAPQASRRTTASSVRAAVKRRKGTPSPDQQEASRKVPPTVNKHSTESGGPLELGQDRGLLSLMAEAASQLEAQSPNLEGTANQRRDMQSADYPQALSNCLATEVRKVEGNSCIAKPCEGLDAQGNQAVLQGVVCKMIEKLSLQLYPADDFTRKRIEEGGHNPHLELTLKGRKPVPSIIQHLLNKWGLGGKGGELRLYPLKAKDESRLSWSLGDKDITAGDMHEALGSPPVCRLQYAWSSQPATSGPSSDAVRESQPKPWDLNKEAKINEKSAALPNVPSTRQASGLHPLAGDQTVSDWLDLAAGASFSGLLSSLLSKDVPPTSPQKSAKMQAPLPSSPFKTLSVQEGLSPAKESGRVRTVACGLSRTQEATQSPLKPFKSLFDACGMMSTDGFQDHPWESSSRPSEGATFSNLLTEPSAQGAPPVQPALDLYWAQSLGAGDLDFPQAQVPGGSAADISVGDSLLRTVLATSEDNPQAKRDTRAPRIPETDPGSLQLNKGASSLRKAAGSNPQGKEDNKKVKPESQVILEKNKQQGVSSRGVRREESVAGVSLGGVFASGPEKPAPRPEIESPWRPLFASLPGQASQEEFLPRVSQAQLHNDQLEHRRGIVGESSINKSSSSNGNKKPVQRAALKGKASKGRKESHVKDCEPSHAERQVAPKRQRKAPPSEPEIRDRDELARANRAAATAATLALGGRSLPSWAVSQPS